MDSFITGIAQQKTLSERVCQPFNTQITILLYIYPFKLFAFTFLSSREVHSSNQVQAYFLIAGKPEIGWKITFAIA